MNSEHFSNLNLNNFVEFFAITQVRFLRTFSISLAQIHAIFSAELLISTIFRRFEFYSLLFHLLDSCRDYVIQLEDICSRQKVE